MRQLIKILMLALLGVITGIIIGEGCMKVQAAELSNDDEYLLQQVALAEAENQGVEGVCYVMLAITNRVDSEAFPSTVYGVISEKEQFAVYSNGTYKNKKPNEVSKEALEMMYEVENKGQTYFVNDHGKSSTWHSRNLEYLFEYKDHKFYK